MHFSYISRNTSLVYIITTITLLLSCKKKDSSVMFSLLPEDKTGIKFINAIQENEDFNIMTYQYLYNGGGVAVGDINGDSLVDIFFTGNMVQNALYQNEGNLKFRDITAEAGLTGRKQWKTGTCMADVNGDGLLDIYVCYSGPGTDGDRKNELYINNGNKNGNVSFTESAAEYGLDAIGTFTTQVVFFDMDRDGDLDLFMVNHADMFYNSFHNTTRLRNLRHPKFGSRLYRNDGQHFFDISKQAGVYGSGLNFGLSVTVSDLNDDGWPDLYTTNDYNEQDFLYLNNKNNTFREVVQKSMSHISKFSMGCDIADFNNDLRPDIVTMDMLPEDNKRQKLLKGPDSYDVYHLLADSGFYYQDMRNMLQLNMVTKDSLPMFSEIGQFAGISNTDWSWAPLFCDLNNDGWKDLYITNGYLRDFTNMDFLKYSMQQTATLAKGQGASIKNWELIKNMPSTKISNYCFVNDNNLRFTNQTKAWGLDQPSISNGAAYADLDNDGDLDLVVNNINEKASVFENKSTQLLSNHFLKLRLVGGGLNTFALGAKVSMKAGGLKQMQELFPVRGFQSSVVPLLHFGLGKIKKVDSLQIDWPDGNQTFLQNLSVDTMLTISASGVLPVVQASKVAGELFTDITDSIGLSYVHKETGYVDFKSQYLLPYQISKQGPFLTKGDVNDDGLEDVFIGGNYIQPGKLFMQTKDGHFNLAPSQPWRYEWGAKDQSVLLMDADGDKDLDLFVVRGGAELPIGSNGYQDQLYLNKGKGVFQFAVDALPPLLSNGSCIASADYDRDGDIDLFIGGRSVPGNFPEADYSYLLRNESKNGKVEFQYASEQSDKSLRHPGIVSSAIWEDINKDGWKDLIVAGAFMPITVYENKNGKLQNATKKYGLDKSNGLWNTLAVSDMDSDGDIDIIAGNMGLNSQFHASELEPLSICYSDFDSNGSMDPLLCYYIQGKQWPLASLDELAEQLPAVRKKFLRYEQYASATLEDIVGPQSLRSAKTMNAYMLTSSYLENDGNGRFHIKLLPAVSQFSSVNGILIMDFDHDGKKDIILHGNYFSWRAQLGRMDASYGTVCKGNGKGSFQTVPILQTGILAKGDVRDMISIATQKGTIILCAKNAAKIEVVKIVR